MILTCCMYKGVLTVQGRINCTRAYDLHINFLKTKENLKKKRIQKIKSLHINTLETYTATPILYNTNNKDFFIVFSQYFKG